MLPAVAKSSARLFRVTAIAAVVLSVAAAASADPLQSLGEALSGDGRYVVFTSNAADLVPGQVDHNGGFDVFLRDRFARTTALVSHAASSSAAAANGGFAGSFAGPLSDDGRYLTLSSDATNLVAGVADTNQTLDAFLYDRVDASIKLISHAAGAPAVAANGATLNLAISRDGSTIVFTSLATNLLPGQSDGNGSGDVFLYHRPSGALALVSHRSGSATTTANGSSVVTGLSADGSVVVFTSTATDLAGGAADTNGAADVFVYLRASGAVSVVSRASGATLRTSNGVSGGGQISADGRWVALQSTGGNLIAGQVEIGALYDEFLFDRTTGKTVLVSHERGSTTRAVGVGAHALSADGRYVAFASAASRLVAGQVDTNGRLDVFLYDRVAAATTLVTHRPGALTTTSSGSSALGLDIDGAGQHVLLQSGAADLVAGQIDAGGGSDAFVYDRGDRKLALVSHRRGALSTAADDATTGAHISRDGSTVGLTSAAGDLTDTPGDPAGSDDVFAYLVGTRRVEGISRPTGSPFVACTLLDSRLGLEPLSSGVRYTAPVAGHCGVPSTARSVALQVTALQGSGRGSLRLYPGNVTGTPSGTLHFPAGATRVGSFTVPLATNGAGTLGIAPLVAGHGTVQAVVVVTGYSD